jgi:hypothetical protein
MLTDRRSDAMANARSEPIALPDITGRTRSSAHVPTADAARRFRRATTTSPRGFFAWFGATVVILVGLTICFAVVVDPYRMYGTPPIPGWTALKPKISDQIDIALTYQLERVRPNTLLLGNSRVEAGFDPESQYWPSAARPVFNAAMPGRGLGTAIDMLRDAVAVHIPRTVIVGLDILDFLEKPDGVRAPQRPLGPPHRRLLVDRNGKPNPQRRLQVWRDRVATTLSIDALTDSVITLLDQNSRTTDTITPFGFDPMKEYYVFGARQGYYELFLQKNSILYSQYPHYPKPDFAQPLHYSSFRDLQKIIDLAETHDIDLILFIHPYHADYLDMMQRLGLWHSFEAWKRALVDVVAAADAAPLGSPNRVRLFDFSGYNRFSAEPVPPAGDRRTAMRWYWEAGHYKSALGDEMLRAMFGGGDAFGTLLTPANIDDVLAAIRTSRSRFRAAPRR